MSRIRDSVEWPVDLSSWKLVAKDEEWELYDMESEHTELRNLASVHPETTREMIKKYMNLAARVGVVEW